MKRETKDRALAIILGLHQEVNFSSYVWDEVKIQPEYWSKRLMFIYRLGRINLYHSRNNTLREKFWRKVYLRFNRTQINGKLNSHVPASANIGVGTIIYHPYGVVINSQSVIGKNATLRHNVTIGNLGNGKKGCPVIGDRVNFGSGVAVIGPVVLGNNITIGVNSVVTKKFEMDNVILAGAPAKIVKNKVV